MPQVPAQQGRSEGQLSRKRLPAINAYQGQPTWVEWIVRDPTTANPVDLRSVTDPEILVRVKESAFSGHPTQDHFDLTGTVVDAAEGKIRFYVTDEVVRKAGIYLVEVQVHNSAEVLEILNQGYLVVNRSLVNPETTPTGPPSIAEIRLHLRDSGPEDNYLLDDVEFDLAEIAACIERPVLYWNETLPPVQTYNTQNFPFRYQWLEGIVACLYELAAHHYRRNRLAYQGAGGTTLDDKNKSQEYEQKAQIKWELYRRWVANKKVAMNAEGCFGSTSGRF